MTLDIIVVYVSAVTCLLLPLASCCLLLAPWPGAGHAPTPAAAAACCPLQCHSATARCVMYDSMKCDIFMLNYFTKKKNEQENEYECEYEAEAEAEAEPKLKLNPKGKTKTNAEKKRNDQRMRM